MPHAEDSHPPELITSLTQARRAGRVARRPAALHSEPAVLKRRRPYAALRDAGSAPASAQPLGRAGAMRADGRRGAGGRRLLAGAAHAGARSRTPRRALSRLKTCADTLGWGTRALAQDMHDGQKQDVQGGEVAQWRTSNVLNAVAEVLLCFGDRLPPAEVRRACSVANALKQALQRMRTRLVWRARACSSSASCSSWSRRR